jgi:hypothetical protein
MGDMRENQPEKVTFDFRQNTVGCHVWRSEIYVYPYSGMKTETVYPRTVCHLFKADSITGAVGIALMLAETIKQAHDVWETGVVRVGINREGNS